MCAGVQFWKDGGEKRRSREAVETNLPHISKFARMQRDLIRNNSKNQQLTPQYIPSHKWEFPKIGDPNIVP